MSFQPGRPKATLFAAAKIASLVGRDSSALPKDELVRHAETQRPRGCVYSSRPTPRAIAPDPRT